MSTQDKFRYLVMGVFGILVIASIVGAWMRNQVRSERGRAIVANYTARVKAWWVMVVLLSVAFFAGPAVTHVLFAFVSFFALREFITLTPTRAADHKALSASFFLVIPAQYFLIGAQWYGLFSILIPVYVFLLLPVLSVLTQDTDDFLSRTAKIQWGVMICVYCISHAPALITLRIPGHAAESLLLLFYFMVVVQISDVLQYVFGMLFGKRKIAPIVSPSKTVEGFVGGGLAATLVGAGLWWITPFQPLESAAFAFSIVIMGFLGGLVLSGIKRSLGAKDWGTMIEGHGGVMDRMDSVSFAAPVFFHLVRYFYT